MEQGKKAGAISSVKGKVSSFIDTEILERVIRSDRELRGSNRLSSAQRSKKASSYEWFGELAANLQDVVSLVPPATLVAIDKKEVLDRANTLLKLITSYADEHRKHLSASHHSVAQPPNGTGAAAPAAEVAASVAASAAPAADTNTVVESASGKSVSIPLGASGGDGSVVEAVVEAGSSSGSAGGESEVAVQIRVDWDMALDEVVSAGSNSLAKSCVRFGLEKLAWVEKVGDQSWGKSVMRKVNSTQTWEAAAAASKANIENSIATQNAIVGGRRNGKGKKKTTSSREVGGGGSHAYATDVIARVLASCRPGGTEDCKTYVFLKSKLVGGQLVKVAKSDESVDPKTGAVRIVTQLPLQIPTDALDVCLSKPTLADLLNGETRCVLVLGFLNNEYFARKLPEVYDEGGGMDPSWHHALLVDRQAQRVYDSNFYYLEDGLPVDVLDPEKTHNQPLLRQIRAVYWISFSPPAVRDEGPTQS